MNFEIIVERYIHHADWTISRFYFDGKFKFKGNTYQFNRQLMGFGIEDELRDVKVHGETAIPAGRYKLTLTHSPKFSKEYYVNDDGLIIPASQRSTATMALEYKSIHPLVLINGIKNFSRVLIHWGNTDDHTEGCYLVGSRLGKSGSQAAVLESRRKYMEVYPTMYRAIMSGADCNINIYSI